MLPSMPSQTLQTTTTTAAAAVAAVAVAAAAAVAVLKHNRRLPMPLAKQLRLTAPKIDLQTLRAAACIRPLPSKALRYSNTSTSKGKKLTRKASRDSTQRPKTLWLWTISFLPNTGGKVAATNQSAKVCSRSAPGAPRASKAHLVPQGSQRTASRKGCMWRAPCRKPAPSL